MTDLTVSLGSRSYPIIIQSGILSELGGRLDEMGISDSIIISDRTVTALYGKTVRHSLKRSNRPAPLITVEDGEGSKSLATLSLLFDRLLSRPVRRDTAVIALGGGVVGDLAGFAAATVLRGIPFIQVPTTLLAQGDSSVGGKTGINHAQGKNLIGRFYQPDLVWIDPAVLSTLDIRDRWAGLGEVVKYGLIADESLFSLLEENLESMARLEDMSQISDLIARCCRIKADIVSRDEKESGLRRILNFGHTLGHALEKICDYGTLRHGEAVVYGMKWAVRVSEALDLIGRHEMDRIHSLLNRFPLPSLPELKSNDIITAIASDKKQISQGLNLVLLDGIGHPIEKRTNDIAPRINLLNPH